MSASTQTGDAPKINPPPVNGHATKKTSKKSKPNAGARKLRNLSLPAPSAAKTPPAAPVMTELAPFPPAPIPFPATALANSWMSGLRAREAELIAEQSATAIRLAEVRKIIAGSARTAKAPKVKAKRRAKKAPAKMAA